jgi:imidazolonepropionase-like amidohydrolase
VFRTAFMEALASRDGKPTKQAPAASKALLDVVDGKTTLRMQAREAIDIRSAARLCDEFGLKFELEYAVEATECLDLITSRKIPVIYGPVRPSDSFVSSYDDATPAYETPKLLAEKGVAFCLTACDGLGDGGLARQVGLAVRYGLDRGRALRSVSADAAAMLGVDKRVGRIAEGLDADLVLWNGAPFDDASRPVLVLVGGVPVFDAEKRYSKENS